MLRNYFRTAYRTILKHQAFSAITVMGLAVGMAAFLFIIQFVRFERSYEDFNPNSPDLVRVTLDLYKGNEYVVTDCETHASTGPLLKQRIPEVRDFARMFHNDGLQDIKVGDKKFLDEGMYFADGSAIQIFSLKMLAGNSGTALQAPYNTIIDETTAKKLYGKTNAVGERITIDKVEYSITGIFADLPPNTHLKFKVLLSHPTLHARYSWYTDDGWNGNNEYLYLLLQPGTDIATLNKKISDFNNEYKEKIGNARYTAQPIRDIHLYSNKTYEPEPNGSARIAQFLGWIGGFIIVIAWVNYVNLSTARALERAREVGIRKVMGSQKSQLMRQFLAEAGIINCTAAVIAIGIFIAFFPAFKAITGQPLALTLSRDPEFWYTLSALVAVGSLLSGIYPAFVLSSFQPVAVLKGKFQSSGHGQVLRRALVVFQFGATVVLITGMVTVYLQVRHLRQYDLGMSIQQTLVVRAPRLDASDSVYAQHFSVFKNQVLSHAEVSVVSSTGSLPGLSLHELSSASVGRQGERQEDRYEFYYYGVDASFIDAMGMKLIAGKNFEDGKANEDQVIVNEEALRRLGYSNPDSALGAKLTFQTRWPGEPARIVGVIRNFYQRSPKESHIPILLKYEVRGDYYAINLKATDMPRALSTIREAWNNAFPDTVFSYFFLDEKYNQQYRADNQFGKVMGLFSGLAAFIACLGLFGLSSYTILQRTKEIGIRKVLGASVGQIVTLLSGDYARVIIIASVLAIPVSYLAVQSWLSNYAVRIVLNAWLFVIPVGIILIIALATVSFQTFKSATANPVKALKES